MFHEETMVTRRVIATNRENAWAASLPSLSSAIPIIGVVNILAFTIHSAPPRPVIHVPHDQETCDGCYLALFST